MIEFRFPGLAEPGFVPMVSKAVAALPALENVHKFSDTFQRSSGVLQPSAVSISLGCSWWTNTQVISNHVIVT